jgi:exonuclease VII small subunit
MIEDTLIVSCPGQKGGLFVVSKDGSVRLSTRPITGLHIKNGQLIYAYQDNGGNSVRTFLSDRTGEVALSSEPMDIHDITIIQDRIYAAATEDNSVICFDLNLNKINEWRLPGEHDSTHLNSVAIYRGQFLASIFGRFQFHRQYKEGTIGQGEVVNIKNGETVIGGLSQPHSLMVCDNLLYLCNSENKEVRVYSGNEVLQIIPVDGYVRGLAVGARNLYAGLSLSRNIAEEEQKLTSAAIAVINRKSMKVQDLIDIPALEIYDIKIAEPNVELFPHLLADLVIEFQRLEELNALYQRGYESYKRANDHLENKNKTLQTANAQLENQNKALQTANAQLENGNQALQQEIDTLRFKNLRSIGAQALSTVKGRLQKKDSP